VEPAAQLQSSVHSAELLLFFTLLHLTVIVLASRLCGNLAMRCGNSRAVGEIVAGILLGPSLFGLLLPTGFEFVFRSVPPGPMTILSQVGLILLLFQIGMEFDFAHLRESRNRHAVLRIALLGELFPFALGFAFGQFSAAQIFPQGNALGYSLFCATAFSITVLPVLGRIMLELDPHRSKIGTVAISAAAINDVAGWLLLAVVSALAVAHFSASEFALKVAMLAAYVGVCWWIVRPLLLKLIHRFGATATSLPLDLPGILLATAFLSGMATYKIGIFAIFGGFMMGVGGTATRPAGSGCSLAREGRPFRERLLRADFLHLHGTAHRHRPARRLADVGLGSPAAGAGDIGQVRGLLLGGALGRDGRY
jgi:Kef-type K+ transport system membrane component KefB